MTWQKGKNKNEYYGTYKKHLIRKSVVTFDIYGKEYCIYSCRVFAAYKQFDEWAKMKEYIDNIDNG
jgi:hypothetical protein